MVNCKKWRHKNAQQLTIDKIRYVNQSIIIRNEPFPMDDVQSCSFQISSNLLVKTMIKNFEGSDRGTSDCNTSNGPAKMSLRSDTPKIYVGKDSCLGPL